MTWRFMLIWIGVVGVIALGGGIFYNLTKQESKPSDTATSTPPVVIYNQAERDIYNQVFNTPDPEPQPAPTVQNDPVEQRSEPATPVLPPPFIYVPVYVSEPSSPAPTVQPDIVSEPAPVLEATSPEFTVVEKGELTKFSVRITSNFPSQVVFGIKGGSVHYRSSVATTTHVFPFNVPTYTAMDYQADVSFEGQVKSFEGRIPQP